MIASLFDAPVAQCAPKNDAIICPNLGRGVLVVGSLVYWCQWHEYHQPVHGFSSRRLRSCQAMGRLSLNQVENLMALHVRTTAAVAQKSDRPPHPTIQMMLRPNADIIRFWYSISFRVWNEETDLKFTDNCIPVTIDQNYFFFWALSIITGSASNPNRFSTSFESL